MIDYHMTGITCQTKMPVTNPALNSYFSAQCQDAQMALVATEIMTPKNCIRGPVQNDHDSSSNELEQIKMKQFC